MSANEPGESTATDVGRALIEIEIPPWPAVSRAYVATIGLGAALLIVITLVGFLFPAGGGFAALIAIGLVLTTMFGSLAVSQRSITESVSAAVRASTAAQPLHAIALEILAASLPKRTYPRGFAFAARELARLGYRGLVIRCHLKGSPPIRPLDVEFEPCPLNEVDVAFRGIALEIDEIDESQERESETWRRVKRLWRMGALGAIAPLVFFFSQSVGDAWRSQTVTGGFFVWLVLLLVVVTMFFSGGTHTSRYWIAPGCLIRRMSLWAIGKYGIDMVHPHPCVLIGFSARSTLHGFAIASKTEEIEGTGTELEIRTLLRAWLSPVSPPSLKRVRDLMYG